MNDDPSDEPLTHSASLNFFFFFSNILSLKFVFDSYSQYFLSVSSNQCFPVRKTDVGFLPVLELNLSFGLLVWYSVSSTLLQGINPTIPFAPIKSSALFHLSQSELNHTHTRFAFWSLCGAGLGSIFLPLMIFLEKRERERKSERNKEMKIKERGKGGKEMVHRNREL